jgi:hypothetical protein
LWKKPRDLVSRILQQNFNKALGKLIFYISIQLMFNFVIKISLVHFAYSWANPIYVCSGLLALIFRSAIVNFSEKLCSNTEPYYIVQIYTNLNPAIDLSPFEWNFDLDKSGQKFHHSLKEHHKISKSNWLSIDQMIKLIINFPFVIQNDWKTANFARLYNYPHFTTFRNETSEFY